MVAKIRPAAVLLHDQRENARCTARRKLRRGCENVTTSARASQALLLEPWRRSARRAAYSFCSLCTSRTPGILRTPVTMRSRCLRSAMSATISTVACLLLGLGFDVADVGVGVADDGGNLLQHAGTVVADDRQLDRIARLARWMRLPSLSPLHVDAPFLLEHQIHNVGTRSWNARPRPCRG